MLWNLTLYAVFLMVCVWIVCRRCKTIVNPVTYYVTLFGLQTLVAPILLSQLGLLNVAGYQESDINKTIALSALYLAAIVAAFLLPISPLSPALNALLPKKDFKVTRSIELISYVQVAVLFMILMYASSAGTLWFTNSRYAYQNYRDGAGVWWALCQAALVFAFGCILCKRRRSFKSVLLTAIPFAAAAYFLGSKGYVIGYLVLAVFYASSSGCKISKWTLTALGAVAICGIISLQIAQGTASSLSDAIEYFDYFTNTSMYLSDFGRLFEHTHGQALLSEVWFYVPRAIYPAKPYVYGGMQIMAQYYPGLAELGGTPGTLQWSRAYLDFGAIGVLFEGLFAGLIARGAFDLLRRKANVWTFLLFAQVGLMAGPLCCYNAPFPLFIVWIGAQWALLTFATACNQFLSLGITPAQTLESTPI